ncbi:MAG: hypothetical protein CYG60_11745 [Actinobacteria bacterium]|nr:MAG: hypothetical protein CYG60_11745 [Actinomycetota bacterium]
MKNLSPIAFVDLGETWDREGGEIKSSSIITTDFNDLMNEIHYCMPFVLHPENYGVWPDEGFDEKEALMDLLKPYFSKEMEAYPVSRRVNRASNNEPSVLEPAA